MNKEVLDYGHKKFLSTVGASDDARDENGFIVLRPTTDHVDTKVDSLTTDISKLEQKLKSFKEEKAQALKYQKSDEYKELKKKDKKKKKKKEKTTFLNMVFNNADAVNEEEDEDDVSEEEGYKDSPKTKARQRAEKKKDTTLDTTYGKRFSPVVAMLYDTVNEFDNIAIDIENELSLPQSRGKTMYRSSQIGNLISAKNSKLSAIRELSSVAKTISDLEYKKDKDKHANEESDSTKAISSLGAKFLRGGLDDYYTKKNKKKNKKALDTKGKSSDDDDEEEDSIKPQVSDQRELANEFANTLIKHKGDISLTPHEKFIDLEGTYNFVVAADPLDPENTWKFIAVDPKSGKEIKDFKDKYKDLYPKKKACRMTFDLAKLKCTDKNTRRSYKLVLTD